MASPHPLAPRASGYTLETPSAPYVHVPSLPVKGHLHLPDFVGVGVSDHTFQDLKAICQVPYTVINQTFTWTYESRRAAQPITPFLYLGSFHTAKDRDTLCRDGITMLMAVRDTRSAVAKLLNGDRVAQELGIESVTVDVSGTQELIAAFPEAIKCLNDHLLSVYRQQPIDVASSAQLDAGSGEPSTRKAKVLVFCETGNERSACVVAAYLMTMYGLGTVEAIQLIHAQRFSAAFGEDLKQVLFAYEDILRAKRDIARVFTASTQFGETPYFHASQQPKASVKRHIEETSHDEDMEVDDAGAMDDGRFLGRQKFEPFIAD